MYGYVAITLRSRRFGYNHQIWLKSYSTIRRIRVRLRPGLGYDQVIGYDDVRLMLGDVGWQWRFVLSGLKVASQDLVTIDPGLKGYGTCWCVRTMPLLWYCLCHRTVFAIVLSLLHLPCSLVLSCCLLYLRYRDVFAMVLSLLRAVLVIVFLPSCFIVLSFSSCCFWCRTVFVMCCAVFGIGRAVQGIALSLSSGWTTSSHLYVAVFVLVASLWLFCPCHRPVFGIALSSVVLCAMVVLFCVPQR